MTLPLKTYRYINYVQLALSVYALIWLEKFFVASVSCNMIDNPTSIQAYLLRFGYLFLPECSAGGDEWIITPGVSIILRIVMVAWIVFSIYVFFRLRKINQYMSSSEPVEFVSDYSSSSEGKGDGNRISVVSGKLGELMSNSQIKRWAKIIFSVTGIWVLVLIIFQGPLLSLVSRYVEEEKFQGNINSINVKFVGDGSASISLIVSGKPVIINSDENIYISDSLLEDGQEQGHFEGFERYDLEDPLLSDCLVGTPVDVYAKRSGVFYTLSGSDRYYIRFSNGGPSCQSNYIGKCVVGGESYEKGEVVYLDEEGYYCECGLNGFVCGSGGESLEQVDSSQRCAYNDNYYDLGSEFSSKDGCSRCLCTEDGVSCEAGSCEVSTYETSENLEVPVYYWYVNEPEPSDTVYVTVAAGDKFTVLSENVFGESPRTELTLAEGDATLVFSVSHVGVPIETPEAFLIDGNLDYPELMRVYHPNSSKYIYSKGQVDGACKNNDSNYECVTSVVGNLQIECRSTSSNYYICDDVMRSFSFQSPSELE